MAEFHFIALQNKTHAGRNKIKIRSHSSGFGKVFTRFFFCLFVGGVLDSGEARC